MFSYIIGEVKVLEEDFVILENNNIGYKINMASRNISSFIKNETRKIYTEFIVREDAILLYGFVDLDELEMFLNLNQVTGIGPKAALSILSTLTVYEIKLAIVGNDIKKLTMAPGIGKKSASRIILELTDKIDIEKLTDTGGEILNRENTIETNENYDIAIEALINLGYNRQDAVNVLKSIDISEMELSDIIKQALKRM